MKRIKPNKNQLSINGFKDGTIQLSRMSEENKCLTKSTDNKTPLRLTTTASAR